MGHASLLLPIVDHSASSSGFSVAVSMRREAHAAKHSLSKDLTEIVTCWLQNGVRASPDTDSEPWSPHL